jgi:exopolysaccharide production protein ExoQ
VRVRGLAIAAIVWGVSLAVAALVHQRTGRLAALRLDREKLALVLLLLATKAIAVQVSADEVLANPVVVERAARGALGGLAALLVVPTVLSRARRALAIPLTGFNALLLYATVASLSVVYSVAPVVSLGKAFEIVIAVVIVWVVALSENAPQRLREVVSFILFLEGMLLASAMVGFFVMPSVFSFELFRPGFVFTATMGSPSESPNVLSATGAMVAAYALVAFLEGNAKTRFSWMVMYLGATAGIVMASGRQGVIIWAVSTAVALFVYRRTLFFLAVVPVVAMTLNTFSEALWSTFNRGAEYHLATLTGRVSFWQVAVESWVQHPWTGFGYGAGGRFVALSSLDVSVTNVHSGYLEALLGVGLLGAIPLAFAIMLVARWWFQALSSRVDVRYAILLVPLALHTAVDLGFAAWLKPGFVIFACLVALSDWSRLERKSGFREREFRLVVPAA